MSPILFLFLYFVAWVGSTVVNTGFLLASTKGQYPYLAERNYRQDLGLAIWIGMITAVIPFLGTLVVLLMTGFAEHGWRLK